ncbi:hypothetical protein BGZ83_004776 [Gryganskiella cystojenkinii]|nr:hypothetical protein BGZ83_004776 [Gryganskiella cystojenkinii]
MAMTATAMVMMVLLMVIMPAMTSSCACRGKGIGLWGSGIGARPVPAAVDKEDDAAAAAAEDDGVPDADPDTVPDADWCLDLGPEDEGDDETEVGKGEDAGGACGGDFKLAASVEAEGLFSDLESCEPEFRFSADDFGGSRGNSGTAPSSINSVFGTLTDSGGGGGGVGGEGGGGGVGGEGGGGGAGIAGGVTGGSGGGSNGDAALSFDVPLPFFISSDCTGVEICDASPDPSVVIDPVDEWRDPVDDSESEEEFEPEDFSPLGDDLLETAVAARVDSFRVNTAGVVALSVSKASADTADDCCEASARGFVLERGGVRLEGGDPAVPGVFDD